MKKLDLDQVVAVAVEGILRKGQHAPLVFVTTTSSTFRLPIPTGWGEDASSRAKTLFLLGRKFGQEHRAVTDREIEAIFLVAEVWAAGAKAGEPAPSSVEEDPNRRECLSVMELRRQETTLDQTTYLLDILREGGVVDLGPRQTLEHVQSLLLTSFFAGIGSAKLSDAQLLTHMQQLDGP